MTKSKKISTNNLSKWPKPSELRKLCQSLAILAWIQVDWGRYRFSPIDNESDFFKLNNGQGDSAEIIFDPSGTVMKGFHHECPYAFWYGENCPWPQENGLWLPSSLQVYWQDFFEDESVSFISWFLKGQSKWSNLKLKTDELEKVVKEERISDPDGSEYIWSYFPSTADLYCLLEGKQYYERDFDKGIVASIYDHGPIDRNSIKSLNPNFFDNDIDRLMEVFEEISYPGKLSI